MGTVGLIAGGILWAIARPFETILPFLGHGISNALWEAGSNLVTFLVSVVIWCFIYPIAYLCNNVADFYDTFRDKVRSLVALIYAKADSSLYNYNAYRDECACIPSNTVHSPEFRAKVQKYKPMTWAQLLCGELANAPHQTPDVEGVPLLSQEDNDSKKQGDGNKDQQPNLRKESRDGAQPSPEPAKEESDSGRNSSVTDTQTSYLNASCVFSSGFVNKKRLQELEQRQQTQAPQEGKQTRESSEEISPSC